MAVRIICKLLISFSLWLLCLVSSVPETHAQVNCNRATPAQCEKNYYCDDDYRCKKCAQCEHFQPSSNSTCPKSPDKCGLCLDGYELQSPGKCVQYTTNIFFIWVVVASSTAIFIILVITAAVYCIRKNNETPRASYCPEDAIVDSTAVLLAPTRRHPSAPPPPYANPPFNPHYEGSSEPHSKHLPCVQEIEMDIQQMANPYSNCVNLPQDINSYNFERSMEEPYENFNAHVDMAEDPNDAAAGDVVTNNLPVAVPPLSRRASERRVEVPAEADTDADLPQNTPLLSDDTTTPAPDRSTMVGIIDATDDTSDSDHESPRPPAPDRDAGGDSQQLIVQIISNILLKFKTLNFLGNKPRH